MSNMIQLIKGDLVREVSEKEYELIKDDMCGWSVKLKVPTEVAERLEEKPRKNAKQ